jgi:putative Mg2+ transporter-C (MgtC) family protein
MDLILEELLGGISDLRELARVLLRLAAAALVGAIAGFQRERAGKSAGLRTHMLVGLGAAVFVMVPLQVGIGGDGISRVIQGLATGIGFIGGGAILKLSHEREIHGLTTAAGLWMTAAAGVAVGLGALGLAIIAMLLTWLILVAVRWLEARLEIRRGNAPG